MAIQLDATAHPGGAPISATQDHVSTGSTLATGTFSTAAGGRVLVALVFADSVNAPFPATISGGGLTWTLRASAISTSFLNESGSAIYTAYASGTLSGVAITATFANAASNPNVRSAGLYVWALADNAGGFTDDASVVGASSTLVEEVSTVAMQRTVTPQATGSWLFGIFGETNNLTVPTADSNTTPWDSSVAFSAGTADALGTGRYKSGGTVATTTAATPVTFGSASTNTFLYLAALEIKLPAGAVLTAFAERRGPPGRGPNATRGFRSPKAFVVPDPAPPPGNASFWTSRPPPGARGPAVLGPGRFRSPAASVPPTTGFVFPLTVDVTGRYLVDQRGIAFPVLGDSTWELAVNLSRPDQETLLNDRLSRGFTSVLFEAIEHKFSSSKPPKNLTGDLPFTKRLDAASYTGSPNGTTTTSGNGSTGVGGGNTYASDAYANVNNEAPDFTFPNATYWAAVDALISLCAARGMAVFLWPAYYGFNSADEGWNAEMVANDAVTGAGGFAGQSFADPSKSKLWNYGAWLGDRYKAVKNIVWVLGGDNGIAHTFSTAQSNAVLRVYQGISSVPGASTLWSGHWDRPSLASDISADVTNGTALAAASALESFYANTEAARWGRSAYAHSPAQPSWQIEGYYENNATGGTPNRRLLWWAWLGGIAGQFFGNENEWVLTSTWATTLASTGSLDAARLNAFIASVQWWKLVPAGLGTMSAFVTAGGGTASPQSTDYVSAAATPDGSLLVAYRPPAHAGTITIDMSVMGGTTRSRWFDPTSGTYTADATGLANSGTHVFTAPGAHADTFTDWVLVLDALPRTGTLFAVTLAGVLGLAGALKLSTQKVLGGTLTSSGTLAKQVGKVLAGTFSTSGALLKQAQKVLGGTLTSSGALLKLVGKLFAGTLTSSGTVTLLKVILRSFGGTLGISGTLTRQTGKALGGTLSSSGTLTKFTTKTFAGVLGISGGLTKRISKAFAGALSFVGTLVTTAKPPNVDNILDPVVLLQAAREAVVLKPAARDAVPLTQSARDPIVLKTRS